MNFFPLLPFAVYLLLLAVFPMLCPHLWERLRFQFFLTLLFVIPVGGWLLMYQPQTLNHALNDYASFILLTASIFICTRLTSLKIEGDAHPLLNVFLLFVASLTANVIGTTGASLLFLPSLLQINRLRNYRIHLPIFFILIVSNVAGLLTPMGDPPLFMGFLKGVPYFWTLFTHFDVWVTSLVYLFFLFFVTDIWFFKRENIQILKWRWPDFQLQGGLYIIILCVVMCGLFLPPFWRLSLQILAVLFCLGHGREIIQKNPIPVLWPFFEVAIVFLAIFITLEPALEFLRSHAVGFGLTTPKQFYVYTGVFSTFLDNAPTYLVFMELAKSIGVESTALVAGVAPDLLKAVGCGAVMMGANSYIGNAPNFLVKSISEKSHIKMPAFFTYILLAMGIMSPLYLFVIFFFM